LPGDAQIDTFKDEITSALQTYSQKITKFKENLTDCEVSCDGLREEIAFLEEQSVVVPKNAVCALSGESLGKGGEDYYVFPSGYCYSAEALKECLWEWLSEEQQIRLVWLVKVLDEKKRRGVYDGERSACKVELDGLIGAECPLTGRVVIEKTGKSLPGAGAMDTDDLIDLQMMI